MDYYKGTIPILEYTSQMRDIFHPKGCRTGAEPRDMKLYPKEMFDPPSEMDVYQESDWDAIFDEAEKSKNSLEHIYLRGGKPAFVNLDQNGDGYCWHYSSGHAAMLLGLANHQPIVRLNPHAGAAIIKGGKDEGGWCGLSGKFIEEVGIAEEGTGEGQWPVHSRNLKYDTPALRKSMALRRFTEGWVDVSHDVYDRQLSRLQRATCGFRNTPVPSDFNQWGHSVCQVRWVRIERGSWGPLILNSWLNWGRFGLAVLRGSQANADSAIAPRVLGAAA